MSCADVVKVVGLGAQVAGAVGSTYSSYRKSQGEAQGYEYQATVARNNEQLAEWQAQDALERGVVNEQQVRLNTAKVEGQQRSILASRNVAINEGSALNILADTKFLGERDARTAGDNSRREAWALRNQGKGYASNAAFLQQRANAQSPGMDAAGTALAAAGKVAQSWYSLRNKPVAENASPYETGGYWGDS